MLSNSKHHLLLLLKAESSLDRRPYVATAVETCISLLQSRASSLPALAQIHAFALRRGVAPTDALAGKHLVFAAVSLSAPMTYAERIFSQIHRADVFTWNTMIRGHADSVCPARAVELYGLMRVASVRPDTHCFPFLLKAVAKLTELKECEKAHSVCVRLGFESLVFVQNALLHAYASCGRAETAHKVFDGMKSRDLVAWNTVINGFALNGMPNEALMMFREMGLACVGPDGFTMVSLVSACTELGALALGRRVHVYVLKVGLISNGLVGNAILDLYSKCGIITEARRFFGEMKEKSVVSWTCLVVGLAVNGFGKEALGLFEEMVKKILVPTEITFVGVLYACSHCGMVDEGFEYFTKMEVKFGIIPRIEHYGCLVDLLGRAGLVNRAYEFIKNMPLKPNSVIWRTLLGACTLHGNLELGELARTQVQVLEPGHSGDYVLLSNLYASESRWTDVQSVRRSMQKNGVWKTPGYSIVELRNQVYEFVMGRTSHPKSDETYAKLVEINGLLKLEGYVARTSDVLADIEEEEKENALSYHSEKIAVAFMLINASPGSLIRIIKNLRVCVDCHVAFKMISKVYGREIVVRDCNRFHHFRSGSCSCGDYW